MKKLIFVFLLLGMASLGIGQDNLSVEEAVRLIADQVIADNTRGFIDNETGVVYAGAEHLPKEGMDVQLLHRYSHFYYHNGVINIAMADLGVLLSEQKYIDYTINTVDYIFNNAEYFRNRAGEVSKWSSPFGQFFVREELDDVGAMGASIIDAYFHRENDGYLEYLDIAGRFVMEEMSRLEDGTFARHHPSPMTIWADDLYMSVPFLARMGKLTGEDKYFDEAVRQVANFDSYLWDETTGLYFHSWHSDEQDNGLARWGRANGWVMMAKVELLKCLPEEHPGRNDVIQSLVRQIKGVARYQSVNGLWHQLLDKEDIFLETSCSAMFSCGTAYAVNQGFIPERYIDIASKGWEGISGRIHTYNRVSVAGICSGTGIGNNLAYYYNRETNPNDVGFGAVISAAAEIIRYQTRNAR
jgi:unsaturated rhamnogalacturonyl hydrolase